MLEHRQGLVSGFTPRFKIFRLVHWESFGDIRAAIAREKEIKGWRRQKKIHLIEETNPTWEDLASQLPHKYPAGQQREKQIPHPVRKANSTGIRDDMGTNQNTVITQRCRSKGTSGGANVVIPNPPPLGG